MTSRPVSAAVAVETLKIHEERDILAEVGKVGPYLQEKLQALAHHPLVGEARGVGRKPHVGGWEASRSRLHRKRRTQPPSHQSPWPGFAEKY
jgi:adenosylmethionine-8-amino-7-oxononanoate aminotransferase